MIRACIFDLDGTLIDTERLWVEATQRFLEARGKNVAPADAVQLVYGHAWHDVHRLIVQRYPDLAMPIEAMDGEIRPHFRRMRDTRDVRIHESIAQLRALAADYRICIVSGSYRLDIGTAIEAMGIGDVVEFFLGSEDFSPGKPDPAGFLMAARQLGLAPAECLVFEDSTAGTRAARAAGMYCVALRRPGAPEQDLSAAHEIVADLTGYALR